jgi:hypothetical protein
VPPRPVTVPPAQALAANPAVFHPLVVNSIAARGALVAAAEAPPPRAPSAVHIAAAPARPILQAAAPLAAIQAAVPAASPTLQVSMAAVSAVGDSPGSPRRDFAPVTIRSDVMALHVQELGQRSTPQTVTSKNFKLSFDYCLVEAERTWLSGTFLTARNWYVPHTKAGEIASGTGAGGGSFEVLPVAALVVQNLVIEADWSHDDTVILQSSVNFGPFSLVGRTIDQAKNTLSCKGMQVVAWVFEPMPRLPYNSDPTMS